MSDRRVLVTGCAGYIGSVLCSYLLRDGCTVVGVDSLMYGNHHAIRHLLGDKQFEFIKADAESVCDYAREALSADVVIPLAAIVGAPACDANHHEAHRVNLDAVRVLVDRLSQHQRVIYPNTNSGYGQTDGNRFLTEEDKLNPVSVYGVTKVAAEEVVLESSRGVSLRLATVFGVSPRMRFDLMVNDFTRSAVQDGRIAVFQPEFKRNFVHVRDVARAFVRMVNGHETGVYNVGLPDANLSKHDLACLVSRTVGPAYIYVKDGADPDVRNYLVSSDKLLGIGFEFRHALEDGIREVAQLARIVVPEEVKAMRNA